MFDSNKCIDTINLWIENSKNTDLMKNFPISEKDIIGNQTFCELLIDFLGDIYVYAGLDEQYNETKIGKSISEAIGFLSHQANPNQSGDG